MQLGALWLQSWWIFIAVGMLGWLFSLRRNNVNNVDTVWSMFFLLAALWVAMAQPQLSSRQWLLLALIALWALRLSLFLSIRNWGKTEDWRYAAMRDKRGSSFRWRSIYVVYVLQALIAMVIFSGLMPGLLMTGELGTREILAASLSVLGIIIETLADWQLYQFKKRQNKPPQPLQHGLWAYTRHPNYFGESLYWWGLFVFSLQVDTMWTIISPAIMLFLLLRVSGVSMMENGRTGQHPAYQQYQHSTPAFWPRLRNTGTKRSDAVDAWSDK